MIKRSEIFAFAKKKFDVSPDYPFEKYPHYAVLRHADDDKWFGLVMLVTREKLGLQGTGEVEIIDIKCDSKKVDDLRKKDGFLPAYHMNKNHWLTMLLDGSVSNDEIFALMEKSYELTK
jgi:predicted DNA-binding protein (MmcQ/YjbR family)